MCQYSDGSGDPLIIGAFLDKANADKVFKRIMLTKPSMDMSIVEVEILDA